jgi:hypothetical protein
MLMVTPQFAAGAGIVIAAVLAVDVPHAALSYGPNPQVSTCSAGECTSLKPPGTGGLTTSDPGVKIKRPRHRSRPPAAPAQAPAAPSQPGEPIVPHADLQYQTIRHVESGFIGMITVEVSPKAGGWSLAFAFSGAKVQHVWGAQWRSDGSGGAVVSGQPWPWPGQKTVTSRIVVFATGTSSAPAHCTFDGASCAFG